MSRRWTTLDGDGRARKARWRRLRLARDPVWAKVCRLVKTAGFTPPDLTNQYILRWFDEAKQSVYALDRGLFDRNVFGYVGRFPHVEGKHTTTGLARPKSRGRKRRPASTSGLHHAMFWLSNAAGKPVVSWYSCFHHVSRPTTIFPEAPCIAAIGYNCPEVPLSKQMASAAFCSTYRFGQQFRDQRTTAAYPRIVPGIMFAFLAKDYKVFADRMIGFILGRQDDLASEMVVPRGMVRGRSTATMTVLWDADALHALREYQEHLRTFPMEELLRRFQWPKRTNPALGPRARPNEPRRMAQRHFQPVYSLVTGEEGLNDEEESRQDVREIMRGRFAPGAGKEAREEVHGQGASDDARGHGDEHVPPGDGGPVGGAEGDGDQGEEPDGDRDDL